MVACHFPYAGCGEDQTANGACEPARGMECRDKVRVDSFAVVPQDGKGRDFSSSLFLPLGFCGDFLAVGVGRVGEFHRGVHLNLFGADA